MEDALLALIIIPTIFVGMPWVLLHYITRWKTSATLTTDDEVLLEELHRVARKLEERMETVERLVAADNPEFRPRHAATNDDLPTQPQSYPRGIEQ